LYADLDGVCTFFREEKPFLADRTDLKIVATDGATIGAPMRGKIFKI